MGDGASCACVVAVAVGGWGKVEGELMAFNEVLKKSPAFAKFLANPTVPRAEKVKQVRLWCSCRR